MRKIALLLILAPQVLNTLGQAPDWLWATVAGDSVSDAGYSIAVDGNGNSYVTGSFGGPSIIFGSTTLASAGGPDMFIVKYDASGNVLWAVGAGGIGGEEAYAISVDGNGNSYVTGRFSSSSITFGSTTLTNVGGADMFIAKFDASGNALWAAGAAGSDLSEGRSIAVDTNGNIYVTGIFGSSSINFGSITLTNAGDWDMFAAKYDASGNVLWAVGAGGAYYDEARSIGVDINGNSYVTGYFGSPSITFGTTTLTNAGNTDMFITKYDASGNALWATGAGGGCWDDGFAVAVANSGDIYVTGHFASPSITFGSTTVVGYRDMFIAKYDASGNALWASGAGGSDVDVGRSIAVDVSGNCYVTSSFFSPSVSIGPTTLTNAGLNDLFIAKYDGSGNALWGVSAGGSDNDVAYSISVDLNGNCYVTGQFSSPSITFGGTTLTKFPSVFYDAFIAKLDHPVGFAEMGWSTLDLFPNPATTQIEITDPFLRGVVRIIEIHDVLGATVFSQQPPRRDPGSLVVDVSELSPGIYFVKLIGEESERMARFIKQ